MKIENFLNYNEYISKRCHVFSMFNLINIDSVLSITITVIYNMLELSMICNRYKLHVSTIFSYAEGISYKNNNSYTFKVNKLRELLVQLIKKTLYYNK